MKGFQIFFYLLIFLFSGLAHSITLPYQNCNPDNIAYTESINSDESSTEAGFCTSCIKKNSSLSGLSYLNSYYIPKECFLSIAIRGNQKFSSNQYIHCPKKNSGRSGSRKLCINGDYIDMIQTSFSRMAQCFDFDEKKQKEIFHLINQESGGILNIQSNSGARCLGQLTRDYVKTINGYISQAKKQRHTGYSKIYDEVIERCPDLENKLIGNKLLKQKGTLFTCRVNRDPYSCLFYTFYGLEVNHRRLKANLNSTTDYMGDREFSDEDEALFLLPIKLKEIMNVKASIIQKDGNPKEVHWVFWDDSELYATLQSVRSKYSEVRITSTKKIPIFENEENIETLFNYWSHNGGLSLSGSRMITMVENLKKDISASCSQRSRKEKRCLMRGKIETGQSLSTAEALDFFQADLKKIYPSKSKTRRKEVAHYVKNIINTNLSTFEYEKNSDKMSKYTNTMVSSYQEAFKFKKEGLALPREDALKFQKRISEICPKTDFIEKEMTKIHNNFIKPTL